MPIEQMTDADLMAAFFSFCRKARVAHESGETAMHRAYMALVRPMESELLRRSASQ